MPRVLRIINRLNLGGPTYNAAYLSKYLAPEFETMLVAGIKEESEESSEFIVRNLGLEPVYIPEMRRNINLLNDWKAYKRICRIIKEFRPDIVHTHAAKSGTLGRLAAYNLKVPVIIHTFHGHVFHSYFDPVKTFIFKKIEKALSNKSTRIIAISDIQKHELSEIHKVAPADKIVVIPLGFDLSRFRESNNRFRAEFRKKYKIDDDTLAILIVGRIVPVKNHQLFLDAFTEARTKFTGKMKGLIVGDGEDRQKMEDYAQSKGLKISTPEKPENEADVIFTSWIKEIEFALAGCDIVAMTSRNEGTPVSLIEAQAAGKPIVSTNVGGIENVVIRDVTALLSPPDDIQKFTENIIKLLNNNELRIKMSDKGWNHVASKYHYTRLIEDTRQLYRGLLQNK